MLEKNEYIIELQYFPCINWIKILSSNPNMIILSDESYRKMSFRNRCVIAGSNGLVNLSVPVVQGRNVRLPYREVKIAYAQDWQIQHWRTIVSCYARSPWFEFYSNSLEKIFSEQFEYLFQLNMAIVEWLVKLLKLPLPRVDYTPQDAAGIIDYRDKWLPKNFQENSISGIYYQLFEDRIGFQPNLSILDLLFMEGPDSINSLVRS